MKEFNLPDKKVLSAHAVKLRRRAEEIHKALPSRAKGEAGEADSQRMLHELQVHQIELEMQNSELIEAREKVESLLANFTDLYDFAPVGYLSLDDQGRIIEINLTATTLLGVERSRLIRQRLSSFIAPASQPVIRDFFRKLKADPARQVCEVMLVNADGGSFWADIQATSAVLPQTHQAGYRIVISDISAIKRAEEAQHRTEALEVLNRKLEMEIQRRKKVEATLLASEKEQRNLVQQAIQLQTQLRILSHQLFKVQEEERKHISRELHDTVTQDLVAISVLLARLARRTNGERKNLGKDLVQAQTMVEESVDRLHQFARDLRPSVLDDLGLIPALRSLVRDFGAKADVKVQFKATASVDSVGMETRTVMYRVTQAALANISQHAQAKLVKVSLIMNEKFVHLEIHDNGIGFDLKQVQSTKQHQRLGLIGMRERLDMLGGRLDITSSPGKGTTISAEIPTTINTLSQPFNASLQ